jgi:hypothetical protein
MFRFIGFVFATCLLAIWTSTTVPAANPDWPKSLTLGTASPGGVSYDYGEALAKILTESLKIDVVESRGGISPPRAPRHVREPLDSYGSRCSAVAMT